MFLAIHWSNPKNTYFGPICFWLYIGAILRIHILVQYVLGLICFGSNMFWYEYVLGTICFGMNMFWSNMFPNMFWAQYVFVQYVLARHVLLRCTYLCTSNGCLLIDLLWFFLSFSHVCEDLYQGY